jgi:hypothetical protein
VDVEPALLDASTENGFVAELWVRATIASVDAITSLPAFGSAALLYSMLPFLLLLKPSRNTPESLYLVRSFFDIRHQFPDNQAQQAHDDSGHRARQDVLVHIKVKHRKPKYHPSNGNTEGGRPEQQAA